MLDEMLPGGEEEKEERRVMDMKKLGRFIMSVPRNEIERMIQLNQDSISITFVSEFYESERNKACRLTVLTTDADGNCDIKNPVIISSIENEVKES